MIHTQAKGQGQRSVGSTVRVETDGWMEVIALINSLMWLVNIISYYVHKLYNYNYILPSCATELHRQSFTVRSLFDLV